MRILSIIVWPFFFIGQLLAISLLTWHLLAQINFGYSIGYQLLDLDKHIAEFAPLNHFKKGFEFTKPQEHWELFSKITYSVQHQGQGLKEINYTLPDGTQTPLMHSAEITHLQDVSHIIDNFYKIGTLGFLMWAACIAIAYWKRMPFPSLRNIALGFFSGIFILSGIILSIGATNVFYWFHTKVFPDGHQWFFYYEDSLMTTLMKAPDIFAFIAILLLSLLCALLAISTYTMIFVFSKNKKKPVG